MNSHPNQRTSPRRGSSLLMMGASVLLTIGLSGCAEVQSASSPPAAGQTSTSHVIDANQNESQTPNLSLSGVVTWVSTDQIVLRDQNSGTHSVAIDEGTIFTVDGLEAGPNAIEVGYYANVIVDDEARLTARAIDAISVSDRR